MKKKNKQLAATFFKVMVLNSCGTSNFHYKCTQKNPQFLTISLFPPLVTSSSNPSSQSLRKIISDPLLMDTGHSDMHKRK